jgi:hypothetical protein
MGHMIFLYVFIGTHVLTANIFLTYWYYLFLCFFLDPEMVGGVLGIGQNIDFIEDSTLLSY